MNGEMAQVYIFHTKFIDCEFFHPELYPYLTAAGLHKCIFLCGIDINKRPLPPEGATPKFGHQGPKSPLASRTLTNLDFEIACQTTTLNNTTDITKSYSQALRF